jgi:riboflavin kinase/FMN adenylyltransferase
MKYLDVSFEDLNIQEELFLTIGNFDGVHRGHQQILNNLTTDSKISKTKSAILSFNPHPKIFFNNEKNFLINSKEKKISILKNLNIDYLIDLKFDNELTQLSFSEFEQNILLNKLTIKRLYLGKDFRYGNQRKGNLETLRSLCNAYNIKLEELELLNDNSSDEKISSSKVRQFLKNGEIEKANEYLIEKFSITGKVILGDQRGRTIGIPTANLKFPINIIKIPYGVYAVQIKLSDNIHFGIVNFGMRPTFHKQTSIVEVHIFDFEEDIYGKEIEVLFLSKIRDEQKFNGIKELLNQITLDITVAKKILKYGN